MESNGNTVVYDFGAIGSGHWFDRLYPELKRSKQIKLCKVGGTSPVEMKFSKLESMGLNASNYYQFDRTGPIPTAFLKDLDVVHISNPNEFHAAQTKESLLNKKVTITEKTWGINREEYQDVVKFIRSNKAENKAYLHLHYIHKQLTRDLPALLEKYVQEHGKITSVAATLFEVPTEEDSRRKNWIFSLESGGLFMDTAIHLFEVIVIGANATESKLLDVNLFAANKNYSTENPTGIEAIVDIAGKFFAPNAKAHVRVAKGAPRALRGAKFMFESGANLEIEYLNSDQENHSNRRGRWSLSIDGIEKEHAYAVGSNTPEIFVDEITKRCNGLEAGLTMEQIDQLFAPQWDYQDLVQNKKLITSEQDVQNFLYRGLVLQ